MRRCEPIGLHEAELPGVVQLIGSLIALDTFVSVYCGAAATTMLPENSDVLPPSRAVAVRRTPGETPLGVGIVNEKRFVVSLPCARPLIAAGP
jgi:hypothetical protein